METINIAIVEDDPEYQEWLKAELSDSPRFHCLSCFDLGEQALAHIPQQKPDIVLMDLALEKSNMSGIECMLRLKLVCPELKVMVITAHSEDDKVFEALKVGAGAYILKGDIPKKLIDVLDEFYRGGAPMSAEIARKILGSFHKSPSDLVAVQQLTRREKEILDLLSQGYMYKEIAFMLRNENDPEKTLSEGTVKKHAFSVYQKLQVNSRHEAIRKYLNRLP